jgi:hypothetical protein
VVEWVPSDLFDFPRHPEDHSEHLQMSFKKREIMHVVLTFCIDCSDVLPCGADYPAEKSSASTN